MWDMLPTCRRRLPTTTLSTYDGLVGSRRDLLKSLEHLKDGVFAADPPLQQAVASEFLSEIVQLACKVIRLRISSKLRVALTD